MGCKGYAASIRPYLFADAMLVIPSLDLETDESRSYAAAVAGLIEGWERDGFARVQLTLGPDRRIPDERVLEAILRDLHCSTQIAGRFETTDDIDIALAAGAEFVVLGTRALDELDWLVSVAGRFPGQLLLSSPARERRARTRGALRTLPHDLSDIASEVAGLALAGMMVEFASDAAFEHPDLARLEDIAEELPFPIQVGGGAMDLATLRDLEFRGVGAVIIGARQLSAEFDGQALARSFTG